MSYDWTIRELQQFAAWDPNECFLAEEEGLKLYTLESAAVEAAQRIEQGHYDRPVEEVVSLRDCLEAKVHLLRRAIYRQGQ